MEDNYYEEVTTSEDVDLWPPLAMLGVGVNESLLADENKESGVHDGEMKENSPPTAQYSKGISLGLKSTMKNLLKGYQKKGDEKLLTIYEDDNEKEEEDTEEEEKDIEQQNIKYEQFQFEVESWKGVLPEKFAPKDAAATVKKTSDENQEHTKEIQQQQSPPPKVPTTSLDNLTTDELISNLVDECHDEELVRLTKVYTRASARQERVRQSSVRKKQPLKEEALDMWFHATTKGKLAKEKVVARAKQALLTPMSQVSRDFEAAEVIESRCDHLSFFLEGGATIRSVAEPTTDCSYWGI